MTLLVDHPAVISLFHDAGIDYREALFRGETGGAFDWESQLLDDDPVSVEVTLRVDDRALTVTLDENLDVVEYQEA
jgi:hypothetical protein